MPDHESVTAAKMTLLLAVPGLWAWLCTRGEDERVLAMPLHEVAAYCRGAAQAEEEHRPAASA
jgi:hypothetical protein